MKFIIFGAGGTGGWAFKYFGRNRVHCFADTHPVSEWRYNKRIISYEEMLDEYKADESIVIIIASEKYWEEMEAQIRQDHIERYFVFRETDLCHMDAFLPWYYLYQRPVYFSYKQVLANYELEKYNKIVIYGVNEFLPYLLIEIRERNPGTAIKIVRKNGYNKTYYSLGFEEISLNQALEYADAMVINAEQYEDTIRTELQDLDKKQFDVLDLFDADDFEPQFRHKELEVYKNIHKGKRIFVIGNGPSLRIEDLNTLRQNHEICMASNFAYRAYDMTPWRADYYCITDVYAVNCWKKDRINIEGTVFVGDVYHYGTCDYDDKLTYFHHKDERYYPNHARFSADLTKGLYAGATVTYTMIQLAAYMGAEEIYLLGVDHGWKEGTKFSDTHFIKNYQTESDLKLAPKYQKAMFRTEYMEKAYEGAEIYSRKHGFRIYNATRGGFLEVFERVDFDSLFM